MTALFCREGNLVQLWAGSYEDYNSSPLWRAKRDVTLEEVEAWRAFALEYSGEWEGKDYWFDISAPEMFIEVAERAAFEKEAVLNFTIARYWSNWGDDPIYPVIEILRSAPYSGRVDNRFRG